MHAHSSKWIAITHFQWKWHLQMLAHCCQVVKAHLYVKSHFKYWQFICGERGERKGEREKPLCMPNEIHLQLKSGPRVLPV